MARCSNILSLAKLLIGDVMARSIFGGILAVLGVSVLIYMLVYGITEDIATFAVFLSTAGVIFQFACFHHDRQAARRRIGK